MKTVGALTREAVANTMPAQSSPDTAAFTKTIGDLEVELATAKLAMQNMELQQSKTNEQRTDDSIANRIAMLSEPIPQAPGRGFAGTSRAQPGNGKCHCEHLDHLSVRVDNVVAELAKARDALLKH